jgi:hypothetical protein
MWFENKALNPDVLNTEYTQYLTHVKNNLASDGIQCIYFIHKIGHWCWYFLYIFKYLYGVTLSLWFPRILLFCIHPLYIVLVYNYLHDNCNILKVRKKPHLKMTL